MPVLTKVEAKTRGGRLLHASVFLLLIIGSTAMVYPFMLMLSGATRSQMDIAEMDLVPNYLTQQPMLVRKFLETKYNYDPTSMNEYRQTRDYSFSDALVPENPNPQKVADFKTFANSSDMPNHWQVLGATRYWQQVESIILKELRNRVRERYNDDLTKLSADLGTPYRTWTQIDLLTPEWANHRYTFVPSAVWDEYFTLMLERPVADRAFVNLTSLFLENVLYPEYGISSVDRFNENHEIEIEAYEDFSLSQTVPPENQPNLRSEWILFVTEYCNVSFVRTHGIPDTDYQDYLRQLHGSIETLNKKWESNFQDFTEITLPADRELVEASQMQGYSNFLKQLPVENLRLVGPEFAWREFLKAEYETIAQVNNAHGNSADDWDHFKMPLAEVETAYVNDNKGALRRRFATRNFRVVADQIVFQGRPLFNTLVYVGLALLFSLTLQPLAAYALSRFNPPGMWKIIFFFMATMAFPPMVATIPMFLIIKELNLLNTFIALVLPVTINGFLIFMLKGFFDSIPQHLYEAAQIEGASEMYMFWNITMSLSKPILAVVALNTFRAAWMAFMYPLIVCPDEKMQVLAVWLHQFQQDAPTSAVFASILLASIPTLVIFMFAQKTIMKGIAVPAEK